MMEHVPVPADKEVILKVRNLKKVYNSGRKNEVRAIDNISFDIYKGETLGLVGESGSGKSTTGRSIIKLESITSGLIDYKGKDISQLKGKQEILQFRKSMQMIFQDPFASLNPRIPVKNIIGDALLLHGLCKSDGEVNEKVKDILHTVGIHPSYASRYPTEFSGGQCQRIGIARALCVRPDFIVADECLSALDVSIQAQIVNLLIQLRQEREMTYLFIAHDLAMVKYISDRIAVMKDGKILELATADELYNHPLHPYTISLLSASPLTDLYKEKQRKRVDYDPATHRYPEGTPAGMFEVSPGHWIYCSEEETEKYKQRLAG
ncbi:MAG: ATP-binding cassette domain-containing protein [Sporomusaceae bacterium]|nr:ATP-binding cassette domain-containing protein [Sporomusaceae bacterium]